VTVRFGKGCGRELRDVQIDDAYEVDEETPSFNIGGTNRNLARLEYSLNTDPPPVILRAPQGFRR
jgi:hypothetical protein